MPNDRIDATQLFLFLKLAGALLLCTYAFYYLTRKLQQLLAPRKIRRSCITAKDLECMLCDETADPQAFPLSLLEEITNDFSDEQQIGRGGFAVVYKGKLENRTVAVKKISVPYKYEKEFEQELKSLMIAKHKNVVRFLGYCADRQGIMEKYEGNLVMADVHQRLLCFEFHPKGSLHEYIYVPRTSVERMLSNYHRNLSRVTLSSSKKNVHFDLKPKNILLDYKLVAKIADFGLSRCFNGETESQAISKICGTRGYSAPESLEPDAQIKRRDSYALDIYSLGVVIMEILNKNKEECHLIDNVVESWSKLLDKSQRDKQLEQVRVCAEIGIKCTNSSPAKRPDTQHIIDILNEIETMDEYTASLDKLYETMHSLNPETRRCFEFCSIFPKGSTLRKDELVCLWIAQGFVKTRCATEDLEDIAREFIKELVSCSFLQPIKTRSDPDCFTVPNVLHDILDKVSENCFRIENARCPKGEGWEADVPLHIQHLFIQNYDGELITETIIGLQYLRTLIVYVVGKDTPVEQKVIASICTRLPELRVLVVAFSQEHDEIQNLSKFSIPQSIGQLKYLRYLAFRTCVSCKITLPSTLNNLQHIQILDFGWGNISEFTFAELVNLRHIFCSSYVKLRYVGRLRSLQTLPSLTLSDEHGCELKELRDLNKLQGKLFILDIENVKSKGKALEANLAAKRLTKLTLQWGYRRYSPEVAADVLEGLCPPVGLKILQLQHFVGSRYPDWMVGNHSGCPKNLQELHLYECTQPGPAFVLAEHFTHLCVLALVRCSWVTLPDSIEYATSLKKLSILSCKNIRSLPSLPLSLESFSVSDCNVELKKSCQTVGHPNWQKIAHIPVKFFGYIHD